MFGGCRRLANLDGHQTLASARRAAAVDLAPEAAARFETVVAYADELPDEPGRFDAAMSSFVLQLVPSRAAALREIRRVLRPGATFAWVTWWRSKLLLGIRGARGCS